MANLTVIHTGLAGALLAMTDNDPAGDKYVNSGREVVIVVNGNETSATVMLNSLVNCDQGFDHNLSYTIAAGETKIIGPFSPTRFNDVDGKTALAYTGDGYLTVAVVQL
jgi:hypothetical protein